jgi:hypothetical protein
MATIPPAQPIPIERLLLDENNPRFLRPRPQDEILSELAAQRKTLKLAAHIALNGLNPLDQAGVVPSKDKPDRYVVHEGNRRLAAVRLLNNPHLAPKPYSARYDRLCRQGGAPIPQTLGCVVFETPEQLAQWIIVKHAGELEGAGTVAWDAQQRGRFNVRSGLPEQYASAYQFLDYTIDRGWITEDDANNVNVSSLTRVLKDSQVQGILHVEASRTGVAIHLPDEAGKRLARRLVADWGRGQHRLPVSRIYNQEKRVAYADTLRSALKLERASPSASPGIRPTSSPAKASRRREPADRHTLVPRSFHISFPHKFRRVERILAELRGLNADRYTNAAAVLFRTFIELSVHAYLSKHDLPINSGDRLGTLTERALKHLEKNDLTAKSAIRPVRAALSAKGGLFSIGTLHEYVHNPDWHPVASELKRHWDNYAGFLERLWT